MSKKVSEFDRYERMRKLEKEAELERRKEEGGNKKKNSRMKQASGAGLKNSYKNYEDYDEEYDY